MPPCLKTLLSAGVGEGQRNDTMFHLGILSNTKDIQNLGKVKCISIIKNIFNPPIRCIRKY